MRQARAVPLPNETLYMEEIKFWLRGMQEHAQFIRSGLPAQCGDFEEALREFQRAFSVTLQRAERLKSLRQSGAFVEEISGIMEEFCRCQRQILADRLNGRLPGSNFPFFLDHLLRESRCFSDFLLRMKDGKYVGKNVSHTKEAVVWLRLMSDHTRLFLQYMDPSERRMRKSAADLADIFDDLVLEARDLSSMLYEQRGELRAFYRFLVDARAKVQRLRDFHKTAEELIGACRLLGVASLELAAHMRRETEHCLLIIALLEKELIKHRPDDFCDDVDEDVWEESERVESSAQEEAEESPPEASADEERSLPQMDAEEPVVAILPLAEKESPLAGGERTAGQAELVSEEEQTAEPPKEKETPEAPPRDETPSAKPAALKERVFAKASDYKFMPGKFAGAAPGERFAREKQRRILPRPLGKR